MSWLIYGANGYTGELVARLAVASAERPILAGRNRAAVESLANDLGLEYRAFDLDDPAAIDAGLQDVDVVAHCAGPFSRTSAPMVAGCLRRGVHYLDLTGEIDVFEAVYDQHEAAKASGVTLVPGVGFDVVPTDYLLARLHAELPTATHAEAALISRGGFSGGTIRSVVEGMRAGGQVRTNGRLAAARVGHEVRTLRLDARSQTVISVPLGDVSSGYRATGIPNIINFTNIPAGRVAARFAPITKRALSTGWIYRTTDQAIAKFLTGPSERRRARTRSDLWAELRDDNGRQVSTAIRVPNTYDFTAHSMLHAVRRMLAGGVPTGALAPSQAFGADFLTTIPGIEVTTLPNPEVHS